MLASTLAAPADVRRTVADGAVPLFATYLLFCALSVLPLFLVAHPPIVDFPNHAARLSLACAIDDPAVSAMYRYRLGIIPNLAADLVNLPLCGLVSPMAVLKGLLAASLALIYAAGWLIQRTLNGRANAFLLFMPLLSFNVVVSVGYINFLSGVAVTLAMVALALRLQGNRGALRLRGNRAALLLVGNLGGGLVFFLHIFALAFAIVAFFGLELRRWPRSLREPAAAALWTAAAFAVPLLLIPLVPGEGAGLYFDYQNKLRALFAPVIAWYVHPEVIGLAIVGLLYVAFRSRSATLHPALRMPLLCLAIYVLALPSSLQDAVDVDARTMAATAWLFAAAMRPGRPDRRVPAVAAAAAGVLLATQLSPVFTTWPAFDREVADLRRALDVLPARARVFSVEAEDGEMLN